ncbi:SAVMC3_10250 family protein [Streptomyces sp. NBC_01378]|uniref:SAVMC3_10250 family protein n=1 Tax=Streptomyces sp. NBC_01378 TaxID=2903844 RepID=UPI00325238BE
MEAEVGAFGSSARFALEEGNPAEPTATEQDAERLEKVLVHLRAKCWARTQSPASCGGLGADAWLEFCGRFHYGAAEGDLGLRNHGVFTYRSLEEGDCPHRDTDFCSNIELFLCGSMQHVRDHRDHPPSRMGSGSDRLHDMAADLVAREATGDTSLPSLLDSTSSRPQQLDAMRSRSGAHTDYAEDEITAHRRAHQRIDRAERGRHRCVRGSGRGLCLLA